MSKSQIVYGIDLSHLKLTNNEIGCIYEYLDLQSENNLKGFMLHSDYGQEIYNIFGKVIFDFDEEDSILLSKITEIECETENRYFSALISFLKINFVFDDSWIQLHIITSN